MVASKDMLPQSTERVVEVSGSPEGIRLAVGEIAKCLIEDWDRSQGTVLYHPGSEGMGHGGVIGGGLGNGYPGGVQGGVLGGPGGSPYGNRRISGGAPGAYQQGGRRQSGGNGEFQQVNGGSPQARRNSGGQAAEADPNFREQKISIPSDMVYVFAFFAGFERRAMLTRSSLPTLFLNLTRRSSTLPQPTSPLITTFSPICPRPLSLTPSPSPPRLLAFPHLRPPLSLGTDFTFISGCIIGRAGTKINEIRRLSGSKISIAKTAHDETGERMFVISGLPENNEKALFLLYNRKFLSIPLLTRNTFCAC